MSFIVHPNHVRNFERSFTAPDHDNGDKVTWIDWIGQLLDTLDDDHYACAFAFERDTADVSERTIYVIQSVPADVTIAEVVERAGGQLDGFCAVLTAVLCRTRPPCLLMLASAGSWTSSRYVTVNGDTHDQDNMLNERAIVPGHAAFGGHWGALLDEHRQIRRASTEGLAL